MEGDVWIISLTPKGPNLHGGRRFLDFSHSTRTQRTQSAWEKEDVWISLSLHKNLKNPICMRKRRCLDFSLTPQEPKEPNLHAIINLVVTICVQRESGSKGKKKERKVVHMSLSSFFMPSQQWIESIKSHTHAHTVNMSQLHTSMSPNCTQVYYQLHTSLLQLHIITGAVFVQITLWGSLLAMGAILFSARLCEYFDFTICHFKKWLPILRHCKTKLSSFLQKVERIEFLSWRHILNEISFFPESIRCCFSPLLQNRKTTCSRIFNTHWFWIGALTGWLLVQASEYFPFLIFQNKLVVEFWFLSTKELRIWLCALGRFLVSLERYFSF